MPETVVQSVYGYVIVGAGSAGCVLANRLSEDPRNRVVLLEAGPPDRNIWLKIPAGISRVFRHKTLNWGYFTEPEPHLNGRRIYWPRGNTLGGSSAINGMAYIRGQPSDYDHWRQLGNSGWSWDQVLPLFKRGENQQRGADEFHGTTGELTVSDPLFRHLASCAFVESAHNAGTRPNTDFNGAELEGVSFLQFTIRKGLRHSTAAVFLEPARRRPNLTIETGAHAERILFEGKRARGIVYGTKAGARTVFGREIVLCGGTINSPPVADAFWHRTGRRSTRPIHSADRGPPGRRRKSPGSRLRSRTRKRRARLLAQPDPEDMAHSPRVAQMCSGPPWTDDARR